MITKQKITSASPFLLAGALLLVFTLLSLSNSPTQQNNPLQVILARAAEKPLALWSECFPENYYCSLWLSDPATPENAFELAHLPGFTSFTAALSPAAAKLAIVINTLYGDELWLVNLSDGESQLLDANPAIDSLFWDPSGSKIAYHRQSTAAIAISGKEEQPEAVSAYGEELVQFTLSTNAIETITQSAPGSALNLYGWQADGGAILYTLTQAKADLSAPAALLVTSPQAGTAPQTLIELPSKPSLHPPAHRALVGIKDTLAWQDLRSGQTEPITPAVRGLSTVWTESGDAIYYTHTTPQGETRLERYSFDETNAQFVQNLAPAGDWRLISLSKDEQYLAAYHYYTGLYLFNLEDQTATQLPSGQSQLNFITWIETGQPAIADLAAAATPTPTPSVNPTPVCPTTSCAQKRLYRYQPPLADMRNTFSLAARNELGSAAPVYSPLCEGVPCDPVREVLSPARPIYNGFLRGMAQQESLWIQFSQLSSPYYIENRYGCTLVSFDCGYGIMQITDCMDGSCTPAYDTQRVAGDWVFNIGAGTDHLIDKWNGVPHYVGVNDHTRPAEWYFAITAYNGLASKNNPLDPRYNPRRPPFGEALPNPWDYGYPYQELVYGYIAHPEWAAYVSNGTRLWRPSRIPEMPRELFILLPSGDARFFPEPVVHLFQNQSVTGGVGNYLVLTNPTSRTQAVDIILYNNNHTFNRRWLDPSPVPEYYVQPGILLNPGQTRTLAIAEAFLPTETFNGYIRINASEGMDIELVTSPPPSLVSQVPQVDLPPQYLPFVMNDAGLICQQLLLNPGFETMLDGKAQYWVSSAIDTFPLVDSSWFLSGYAGAYLGGDNSVQDAIYQQVAVPAIGSFTRLAFDWYMTSSEPTPAPHTDFLDAKILDSQGNLLKYVALYSDQSQRNTWQHAAFDLTGLNGKTIRVAFTSLTSPSNPTSYYIDNVQLLQCP